VISNNKEATGTINKEAIVSKDIYAQFFIGL
jgi:hypothetical protein